MKTFFRTITLITLGLLTLSALVFGIWINQAKADYETAVSNAPIVAQNTPASSVTAAETPTPNSIMDVVITFGSFFVAICIITIAGYFLIKWAIRHPKEVTNILWVLVALILSPILVPLALYFLPSIIAWKRKHRNFLALSVLNFLTLPSLGILWIVALIWALLKEQTPVVVQALPTPS